MILVGFAVRYSLLVIRAGYDRGVAVHVDFQVGEFGNLHLNGRVGAMRNVSGLAVGVAVFDRDHEILSEERSQDVNFVLLVGISPFHFQVADLGGVIFLREQGLRRSE